MEEVCKEQIVCVFENDEQIPIFDKDQWQQSDMTQSSVGILDSKKQISTTKQIPLNQNKNINLNLIQKVTQQIEKSKENFFKVNVVKRQSGAKTQQKSSTSTKQLLPAINQKNKNKILIQDFVDKKTDGFIFKWNRRYLALTCQKLYFFTNEFKAQLIGCVNLKLLNTKIRQSSSNQLTLDFMGQCQNIILKFDKDQNRSKWKQWLKQVVNYQAKQNKVMIQTLVKPLYNNKDSITQKQYLQTAETGDILLFYTKNTGAKIQRFLTNSDFDHVAMVVKLKRNQLMVFESNQMYGVSIYDWKQYIQYFDLYQKITLRKLNYIKKADCQRQILNFVKKNLGKNYEINMNKLMTLESDVNWDKINIQKTKERGYFCSELIAKVLKSVGLLDQKKSCGRYWPVDFAEKNGLLLKKGAFLGREQVIILNKHLKKSI